MKYISKQTDIFTRGLSFSLSAVTCLLIGLVLTSSAQAQEDAGQASLDRNTVENENLLDELALNAEKEEEEGAAEAKIAPNLDLSDVAPIPEPIELIEEEAVDGIDSDLNVDKEVESEANPAELVVEDIVDPELTTDAVPETAEQQAEHFVILGAEVQPGTATRLAWSPGVTITGLALPTPVLVINGAKPGPTLCLSGAVHGDELNGIEIVRRVMYDIDPERLSGKVIGVPIVNLQGFQRGSRYLPDRRDLNRFFPGDENGSLASRIAHSLFEEVISHCEMLVDLHTGSLGRTNLPQIRADMNNESAAKLTEGFDKMVVVHSPGSDGMLRTAASNSGIVSVTMEVGESMRVQENDIRIGVNSIYSLMDKQGMFSRRFVWGEPAPVYYTSFWLRVQKGGLLFSDIELGDTVQADQVLGTVTDPITNEFSEIVAPVKGRIIGMAVDQVVMPGFAAYHVGQVATEETIVEPLDLMLTTEDVVSGESGEGAEIDPE